MIKAIYNKDDLRYLFLTGDVKDLKAVEKHLNKIPSYMFLPSFSGIPKPVVFLHKFPKSDKMIYWCHSGLWKEVADFCKDEGIVFDGPDNDPVFKYSKVTVTKDDFKQWVDSIGLSLQPRDYQVEAAWKILRCRQSMSQLATRSGKTLIAYLVFRWMLEKEGYKNVLMIVPSVSLVKQGVADMAEYKEFFNSETVWSGGELCQGSNLTIGTFQSLVKKTDKMSKRYDPKFFNKFDVVCCDECHKLPCKSIDTILSQPFMKDVGLRFGFSGTIPQAGTIENYACQSLMGPVIQSITSKELIEEGVLAEVDIEQIRVRHAKTDALDDLCIRCAEYINSNYKVVDNKRIALPEKHFLFQHEKTLPFSLKKVKESNSREEYMQYLIDLCKSKGSSLLMMEQMMMFEQTKRLDVMEKIFSSSTRNGIVFAHHTEYLKALYEWFTRKMPDKRVLLITGSTPVKKRTAIMKEMEENDSCILFASYACVGTGLTFKNVDWGVFAESFKSEIIVLQSIGRGLLKSERKSVFKLYDIIDCFPTRRLEFQGNAKLKTYKQQQFKCTVTEV